MQLNNLKRKTKNKGPKRVGRGGLRGKTSGRGTKGQSARAGHRIRPDVREKLKKLPKLRGRGVGGLMSIQEKVSVVNVGALQKFFSTGDSVDPKILIERKLVRARRGDVPVVKILGGGELDKKLDIFGCKVSASAKEKIEKAGGVVK